MKGKRPVRDIMWRDKCDVSTWREKGKKNKMYFMEFILTDIHLNSFSWELERSAQLVQTYIQPGDWILPNADKPSLLDKREFSLLEVSKSSRFNGATYLLHQRDSFNNFCSSVESAQAGSCHTSAVKTLKQASMGTMQSTSLLFQWWNVRFPCTAEAEKCWC